MMFAVCKTTANQTCFFRRLVCTLRTLWKLLWCPSNHRGRLLWTTTTTTPLVPSPQHQWMGSCQHLWSFVKSKPIKNKFISTLHQDKFEHPLYFIVSPNVYLYLQNCKLHAKQHRYIFYLCVCPGYKNHENSMVLGLHSLYFIGPLIQHQIMYNLKVWLCMLWSVVGTWPVCSGSLQWLRLTVQQLRLSREPSIAPLW